MGSLRWKRIFQSEEYVDYALLRLYPGTVAVSLHGRQLVVEPNRQIHSRDTRSLEKALLPALEMSIG